MTQQFYSGRELESKMPWNHLKIVRSCCLILSVGWGWERKTKHHILTNKHCDFTVGLGGGEGGVLLGVEDRKAK